MLTFSITDVDTGKTKDIKDGLIHVQFYPCFMQILRQFINNQDMDTTCTLCVKIHKFINPDQISEISIGF